MVKVLISHSLIISSIFLLYFSLNLRLIADGKNVMEFNTTTNRYKVMASSPSDKRLWESDVKKIMAKFAGGDASMLNMGGSLVEKFTWIVGSSGPRPMLDLGRRGPAGPPRQDSQPQMQVSERRKTVKLAFGGVGSDGEEDIVEETDEVQLEVRSGGGLIEEDRRKTVKLEFGLPQRQLTSRDRSATVELEFKRQKSEESNEGVAGEQDRQQITDKRKTVKLAFETPSALEEDELERGEQSDASETALPENNTYDENEEAINATEMLISVAIGQTQNRDNCASDEKNNDVGSNSDSDSQDDQLLVDNKPIDHDNEDEMANDKGDLQLGLELQLAHQEDSHPIIVAAPSPANQHAVPIEVDLAVDHEDTDQAHTAQCEANVHAEEMNKVHAEEINNRVHAEEINKAAAEIFNGVQDHATHNTSSDYNNVEHNNSLGKSTCSFYIFFN